MSFLTKQSRANNSYSNLWNALIGTSLAVIGTLLFFQYAPEGYKWGGSLFLYLPEKIGMLQPASSDEVLTFRLDPSRFNIIHIHQPGSYFLYTDDYSILQSAITTESSLIVAKSATTGEAISLKSVSRGLRPYDTPHVTGRPINRFDIEQAGEYQFTIVSNGRNNTVSIVPDYIGQNENTFVLAYIIQLLLLAYLVWFIYYRRNKKIILAGKADREAARTRYETWSQDQKHY